jgi:hypothetical protein
LAIVRAGSNRWSDSGQERAFASGPNQVCNAALNRPSMPSVSNAAVFVPY